MEANAAITDVLATNGRITRLGPKQLNYLIDAVVRRAGREVPDVAGLIREQFNRQRNEQ